MKFGPVRIDDAEGAILAHTHRLKTRTLKKGHRITKADLPLLKDAGHETITVAILEPGDVHEDEAADRVAAKATGKNVEKKPAHTGRANLFATAHGLLVVDRERLDRVNLVDEAITIATLEPYAIVAPGDMIATVKIIPFAARDEALRKVEADTKTPLVEVAIIEPKNAGLIITVLPDISESQLERAEESQRQRMRALGGDVPHVLRAKHDAQAVKAAIAELAGKRCDLVFVLGASAIIDRHDVIPEAIRLAGGVVKHFGMPVDPGNLLLLGALGDMPVIGLPGCSRSISPSGFDRVLERIVAGLEVTREDIMRMGAGGLMKDTEARLFPRQASQKEPTPRVAAVVLAAGQSRRMGASNKLLSDVEGRPMIRRVVEMLKETRVSELLIVLGHQADRVCAAIEDPSLTTVENASYAEGLSTSIRTGALAIKGPADAVLFVLGDMPWVKAEHVERLIDAFNPAEGRAICVPVFEGRRGNPVLWAARFLPEMQKLSGDVGARPLLAAHADLVHEVEVQDRGVLFDVDTPEALHELLEAGAKRS